MAYRDDMLTAWLDGEMSAGERAKIDQALQGDASLRARLDRLGFPVGQLREEGGALLAMAPPVPVAVRIAAASAAAPVESGLARRSVRPLLAASVVAGLLAGWVSAPPIWRVATESGFVAFGARDPWLDAVARYQALYTRETLAGIGRTDPEAARVVERFALVHGLPRGLAHAPRSLTLRRAQLLGFEGVRLLQIVYASEDGIPVALCIMRTGHADRDVSLARYAHMQGVDWVSAENGFFVIGEVAPDVLLGVASDVRRLTDG